MDGGRVLADDERRPAFLDNAEEVESKRRNSRVGCCPSGVGVCLARVAACNDIHDSTPRSPVERADVVPDREQVQQTVSLPPQQHLSSVRVFLDRTDGTPAEQPSACEQAPASSGK